MLKEKEAEELLDFDENGNKINEKKNEAPEKGMPRNVKIIMCAIILLIIIIGGYLIFLPFKLMKKGGEIELIRVKNYDELSEKAGQIIVDLMKKKPDAVLGLATGSTPIGLYKYLIKKQKEGEISFEKIKTYNLDEYCEIPKTHEQSYYTFMNENLFNKVNIKKENIHIPSGEGNFEKNAEDYDKMLSQVKIDLQLLGIGANGHIGFNEPNTPVDSTVHIVQLTEQTIKDNARFFDNDTNKVPKKAITMGIKNILDAETILLIANGKGKANAIKKLIQDPQDIKVPASALKLHKKVIVIADEEACSQLPK